MVELFKLPFEDANLPRIHRAPTATIIADSLLVIKESPAIYLTFPLVPVTVRVDSVYSLLSDYIYYIIFKARCQEF